MSEVTYNASGIAAGAVRPSLPVVWYRATRPFSFTASIIPILVGSACALLVGSFSPLAFLLCLGGAVALQAGTNLVNDYYDYRKGADNEESLGPAGFIQRGVLQPNAVRNAGRGGRPEQGARSSRGVRSCGRGSTTSFGLARLSRGRYYKPFSQLLHKSADENLRA